MTPTAGNDQATGHHPAAMAKLATYPERARRWWDELSVFWKRRIIVMGIAALVVAIPLTVAVRSGGGGDGGSPTTTTAAVRLHAKPIHDASLGLSIRVPVGWAASQKEGTVVLTSDDHAARLVFGSPAVEGQRAAVMDAVLGGIRGHYKSVTIKRGSATQKIGGIPMEDAVVSARTDSGTPIGIHVAAGSGRHHTYLIESTTGANAPAIRLAQGQAALQTLKLSG